MVVGRAAWTRICVTGPRYTEAIEDLDEAIRRTRNFAAAYFDRAVVYQEIRRLERALEDYSAINERCSTPYANRGALYAARGDRIKGIADPRKAVDLDATNEIAKRQLRSLGVTP
jgi:tetratricopeptide (TPR) repeat protein